MIAVESSVVVHIDYTKFWIRNIHLRKFGNFRRKVRVFEMRAHVINRRTKLVDSQLSDLIHVEGRDETMGGGGM